MKTKFSIVSLALFLLITALTVHGVEAATLKFDPTTVSVKSGDTFDVKVNVDPQSEQITSVDAYVLYDSAILTPQTVTYGTYFPQVLHDIKSTMVYVGATIQSPNDFRTGTGTIATITFKAIAGGTVTLQYQCDSTLIATSKVIKNDANATDIVQCSSNDKATVTVSGAAASTTTVTPTPTVYSTATQSASISQLPKSGGEQNTVSTAFVGGALVFVGLLARLLFKF